MRDRATTDRAKAASYSRLDVGAFLAAFLVGISAYFILRNYKAPQWITTSVLVGIMIVYSFGVWIVPRLRVRLDQAGDNAYYLGLLFTLGSMAFALYDFGASQVTAGVTEAATRGAEVIIANFGIALATTIAGIFLRVLLHQMRVDPADVEDMTRIELAEAAKRVRASLDTLSMETASLLDTMRQRTTDQVTQLVEVVGKSTEDFTRDTLKAVEQLTDASSRAQLEVVAGVGKATTKLISVAEEAEAAANRLKAVEAPPTEVADRIRLVASALGDVAEKAGQVGSNFEVAGLASKQAATELTSAASVVAQGHKSASEQYTSTLAAVEEAVGRVSDGLTSVGNALELDRRQLSELERQTIDSAKAARNAQAASTDVLTALVEMTQGLTDLVNRGLQRDDGVHP